MTFKPTQCVQISPDITLQVYYVYTYLDYNSLDQSMMPPLNSRYNNKSFKYGIEK
jgi:hypothetical protein